MSVRRLMIIALGVLVSAFMAGNVLVAMVPPILVYPLRPATLWQFQAIDTMKSSRDLAREKLHEQAFDAVIDSQVKSIFITGATHVAIDTPYDEEFLPYLRRWIAAARRYNLKVWFRGNWSGWEGWFGYPRITSEDHIKNTRHFIINHTELFEHGDLFTACPECENGAHGDPRLTKQVAEYRRFLIEEYAATTQAFQRIGKNVQANLISMNADVAAIIMDEATTKAVGGLVTVDHYAARPRDYATSLQRIVYGSGGKIVIGEFGAPIPSVHGTLTEQQQAEWLAETLDELARMPQIVGINYWVSFDGSTSLWRPDGTARPAVDVLSRFYQPQSVYGIVYDELGQPLRDTTITTDHRTVYSDAKGFFQIAYMQKTGAVLTVSREGYHPQTFAAVDNKRLEISLIKESKNLIFRGLLLIKSAQETLKNRLKFFYN